jgi:co-chaperonin GroES (HSP10)
MVNFRLTDDHVLLENVPADDKVNGVYRANRLPDTRVWVRVLAVGPGELMPSGQRGPMPCSAGDVVLINIGAGFDLEHEGTTYRVVYGGRKDIIAVKTAELSAVA